jgi:hypothetical protein
VVVSGNAVKRFFLKPLKFERCITIGAMQADYNMFGIHGCPASGATSKRKIVRR